MLKKFLTELARAIGRRDASHQQTKISLLLQQGQDSLLAGNATLAAKFARKAIRSDPNTPQAHYLLGRAYIDQSRFIDAASSIEKAVQLDPRYAIALQDLGNVYRTLGQNEKAATCYQVALQIDEGLTLTWLNMGLLLADLGRSSDAIAAVKRALDHVPTLIEGLKFLVRELTQQERFEEALKYLFRANERQPNSADILNGIGFVLQKQDRVTEAITYYEQGIHISPENAELWGNLGIAYQDLMRLDDAISAYERAQELKPEWLVPRWHRSLAYLLRGDFQRGWEDYELRLLPTQKPKPREFPFERWRGESAVDKSILVYSEQGVGDEIMFASCIPEVLKRSEHCIIECSHKLAPIFRRSFPTTDVIGTDQGQDRRWLESAKNIDLCIPIGSLPLYFRRSPHEFPATNSYLTADEASVAHWCQELDQLGPGLKVGISWKGGTVISR
ncbi:MAG: tetratricopeptide repeat protein, partial [Burkholderiales bacterium]|nr:tetratricopeptide repeat protein [Burkholderiales bacterium]